MAEAVEKQRDGIGEFVKKTRAELDKTSFPSSNDVKNTTIIVVISVIFFGLYLFAVDWIWVFLIDKDNGLLPWLINKIAGA
jgi:preprotein translocase SecE subunit